MKGLSRASRAGIGSGVAVVAIIIGSLLYLFYRRRRRAPQTSPIKNDSAMEYIKSDTIQPQVAELEGGDRSADPPLSPEIDSRPIHEAPDSPRQHKGSAIGDVIPEKPYSQPPSNDGPGFMDADRLSKLEQEERQLQEDIAQIERLERLKAERDRVRQSIRDLSQQQRRDST